MPIHPAPPRAPQQDARFHLRVSGYGWGLAGSPFGRTMRELVALAWPIAAAMGGETLMGLVDTKLVGGLGPAALGGRGRRDDHPTHLAWLRAGCQRAVGSRRD